jgi:muramoyltetrapeptide carboxypeptidase
MLKNEKIKPGRLKKGDTISLITPSGPASKEQLEKAVYKFKNLGFNIVYKSSVLSRKGYLAGSDQERTDEIHEMFINPGVKAIICLRGGYGIHRILPMIDFELIRRNPKIIMGFSDITALLQAIFIKTRLVCFHGPMGVSDFNDYNVNHFQNILMSDSENYTIDSFKFEENQYSSEFQQFVIKNGTAEGELTGGNLTILSALMGTPFEPDFDKKIVFLEDIDEKPYRIDRMLSHLLLTGKLQKATGILLGVFKGCEIDHVITTKENSLELYEIISDKLSKLNIPSMYGFSFGHIKYVPVFPIGIKARIDIESRNITLLENCTE